MPLDSLTMTVGAWFTLSPCSPLLWSSSQRHVFFWQQGLRPQLWAVLSSGLTEVFPYPFQIHSHHCYTIFRSSGFHRPSPQYIVWGVEQRLPLDSFQQWAVTQTGGALVLSGRVLSVTATSFEKQRFTWNVREMPSRPFPLNVQLP